MVLSSGARAPVIVLLVLAVGLSGSAAAQPATTVDASVTSDGADSHGYCTSESVSRISNDGTRVAFFSDASNLTGDPYGFAGVFVHDSATASTVRADVSSDGESANAFSYEPGMSGNGRFVVFISQATNLSPRWSPPGPHDIEQDPYQVYVRDLRAATTRLVSVSETGKAANKGTGDASISASGRYVAFASGSTNLSPEYTGGYGQIFVRDRRTRSVRVGSTSNLGKPPNAQSFMPIISGDGRYVAFKSLASNLVAGDDNHQEDVFVHDFETGDTELVSVSSRGRQTTGWYEMTRSLSMSADGRYVTFDVGVIGLDRRDVNGHDDIYIRDRSTGTTRVASVSTAGVQGDGPSYDGHVSPDGRFVEFTSEASNLVPDDTNGVPDVFVHDMETGGTVRVSVSATGEEANGYLGSTACGLSWNGRFAAFESDADDITMGDLDGVDVFARGPLP